MKIINRGTKDSSQILEHTNSNGWEIQVEEREKGNLWLLLIWQSWHGRDCNLLETFKLELDKTLLVTWSLACPKHACHVE